MSDAIAFLEGSGLDHRSRSIDMILALGDDALESTHDYIQWLFPLPEASAFNPFAPLLSPDDVAALRASAAAQQNLLRAARRMESFYRVHVAWLRAQDHNHLRITRIIRALRLLVGRKEAEHFYDTIMKRVAAAGNPVSAEAHRHWRETLTGT